MRTFRETTIERIRELRKTRGMTQQDLASRLAQVGSTLDRTAIAKIETGKRELTLAEAFQFAWALHVAPVHLFVPTDSDEPISLATEPRSGSRPQEGIAASPYEMRAWVRGDRPLFQDGRLYWSAVPQTEHEAASHARAAHEASNPLKIISAGSEEA